MPSSTRWHFLADNYQVVIIDSPPGLSEDTCAAIRQSDRLAIVITPELPAIHNAIRAIEYLTGLHYPDENIDIVLNRYSRRGTLNDREIEASLRRPIAVQSAQQLRSDRECDQCRHPDRSRSQVRTWPYRFDAWADQSSAIKPGAATANKGSRKLFSLFGSVVKEEING